ncbi:MAG: 4-hydroxy-3-methylbut-2-enyl diphosphate reductase, partial [Eubacterium sp.]|nr:4-hydroxy-3-methylbut-2-enyl diphosphate reductase [Eubacterium sp.]
MEVIMAESAGFCFGVKRAVDRVTELAESGKKPVCTYGPIIHNEFVVRQLEEKGVRVIRTEEELEAVSGGTIVIRSHGVSREIQNKMEQLGAEVVDATCPFVKKIHRIVEKAGEDGLVTIIAGDPDHPEVQGIVGWAKGPVFVIRDEQDLEKIEIPNGKKAILVAQTTFNKAKFEDIVEIFRETRYYENVINTVCNATDERQTEARKISRVVDAMIVVGGRHSSNTQKLYNICKEECRNT